MTSTLVHDLATIVLTMAGGVFVLTAAIQLATVYLAFRGAPQPYWDEIRAALEKKSDETHGYVVSRLAVGVGARLWPPAKTGEQGS